MKTRNLCCVISLATTLLLVTSTASLAQPSNPLFGQMDTSCSGDDLGKVTRVSVLNAKQANAIFKKGGAHQDARAGEIWVQIFVRSKALPNEYLLSRVDRAPTSSEVAALVGKPACTYSTGD